jgi:hypothetical protein
VTAATTSAHDIVLANGRVMDPASGLNAVRHVGITAGKISAVSEIPLQGGVVVDVGGNVVAPGFIDLHAHGQTTSDLQIKAQDGVTTALELEIGVYPVAEWYAGQQGKAPIHYGATVASAGAVRGVSSGVERRSPRDAGQGDRAAWSLTGLGEPACRGRIVFQRPGQFAD